MLVLALENFSTLFIKISADISILDYTFFSSAATGDLCANHGQRVRYSLNKLWTNIVLWE